MDFFAMEFRACPIVTEDEFQDNASYAGDDTGSYESQPGSYESHSGSYGSHSGSYEAHFGSYKSPSGCDEAHSGSEEYRREDDIYHAFPTAVQHSAVTTDNALDNPENSDGLAEGQKYGDHQPNQPPGVNGKCRNGESDSSDEYDTPDGSPPEHDLEEHRNRSKKASEGPPDSENNKTATKTSQDGEETPLGGMKDRGNTGLDKETQTDIVWPPGSPILGCGNHTGEGIEKDQPSAFDEKQDALSAANGEDVGIIEGSIREEAFLDCEESPLYHMKHLKKEYSLGTDSVKYGHDGQSEIADGASSAPSDGLKQLQPIEEDGDNVKMEDVTKEGIPTKEDMIEEEKSSEQAEEEKSATDDDLKLKNKKDANSTEDQNSEDKTSSRISIEEDEESCGSSSE
ncbi:PREDICTED: dentin sialophosphoprotein-like [Branchiostoma belcheri]|uniref:Dentin sialophosphoprotein-like n=1 Tax=Branchiostoma belcheri TaxID=7741 RepID=A0A6P5AKJ3_BRABE|nr:PREDICTED: dentin sialophosphoprotein-like [Branchiostoma belcheri]